MKKIYFNETKILYKNNFLFLKQKYFGFIKVVNVNINIFYNYIEIKSYKNNFSIEKSFYKKIFNLFLGIKNLWEVIIFISGIGFKIQLNENKISFNLGFSKPKILLIPSYIFIDIKKEKIFIKSVYKDKIGNFVKKILNLKKYDPYKKKGLYLLKNLIIKKSSKKK